MEARLEAGLSWARQVPSAELVIARQRQSARVALVSDHSVNSEWKRLLQGLNGAWVGGRVAAACRPEESMRVADARKPIQMGENRVRQFF